MQYAELMGATEMWAADILKYAPLSVRANKESTVLSMDISIEQDMNVMLPGTIKMMESKDYVNILK